MHKDQRMKRVPPPLFTLEQHKHSWADNSQNGKDRAAAVATFDSITACIILHCIIIELITLQCIIIGPIILRCIIYCPIIVHVIIHCFTDINYFADNCTL